MIAARRRTLNKRNPFIRFMIAPFFKTIARNFRYASIEVISPVPILIILGDSDTIVPAHYSSILYQDASEPKDLWIAKERGHIEAFAEKEVRDRLLEYLKSR